MIASVSTTELPAAGTSMYLALGEGMSFRTRLEEVDGGTYTVAAPLGAPQVLRILRESGGTAVAVDDADALATRVDCAADTGVLLSPEGAVALHAVRTLAGSGWLSAGERVVVLNTGSPLVQPETLPSPTGVLSPADALP